MLYTGRGKATWLKKSRPTLNHTKVSGFLGVEGDMIKLTHTVHLILLESDAYMHMFARDTM